MHIEYLDIISRIAEQPTWWSDGVPRYGAFKPDQISVYANEAVLVHIQCQYCRADFHVGVAEMRAGFASTIREQLEKDNNLWLDDQPNTWCCSSGPSASPNEVAVLEFWEKIDHKWCRVPSLEKPLSDGY